MANKIINIGNSNQQLDILNEVYRDISTVSIQLSESEYYNSYDCNLVVTDLLNSENKKYILLLPDKTVLATKWRTSNITKEYNINASKSIKNIEQDFKIDKLIDLKAIYNSLHNIFTWIPGERIINPEFGSMLQKFLYEPITEDNQERIVAEIKSCVIKWEPRVIVDRIVKSTSINDIENNTVKLDIYFTVKGLNNQQFIYQYEYSNLRNF